MTYGIAFTTAGGRAIILVLACLASPACGGSVSSSETDLGDDSDDLLATGGTTSTGVGGALSTGGETEIGTGGAEPYVEPDCPDEPAPPAYHECDALEPFADCPAGEGCYAYLDYPSGEGCGQPAFGTVCAPASTGVQGDFCGDGGNYCAPGYLCVVGATGGKRCGQTCEPVADHNCPAGLICGETDVQGYGVCF